MKPLHLLGVGVGAFKLSSNSANAAKIRGAQLRVEPAPALEIDHIDQFRVARALQDDNAFTTIQDILNESIPDTNFALRQKLLDPQPLELSATVPVGCDALTLQIGIEEMYGLSRVNLDGLWVQTASETFAPDFCAQKIWGAAVDILVSFAEDLVSGPVTARLVGTCGGVQYDQPLTVAIASANVLYTGVANIRGVEGPAADGIATVTTLGTLDLTTPDNTVSVSLVPSELSAYEDAISSQLEAAFRTQLVNVVEPMLRETLEKKIPTTGFGILYKVEDIANSLVEPLLGLLENYLGGESEGGEDDDDGGENGDDDKGND